MFGAINSVLGIGVNIFLRDNFSPTAAKISASMQNLSKGTSQKINAQLSHIQGMSAGIVAAGAASFVAMNRAKTEVDEFNYSLYKVKAISEDMTGAGFEKMKNQALELSRAFPYTAREIAEGFLEFQKAGIPAAQFEKMTKAVLNFATIADIPVGGEEGAALGLIRTMGQFGKGYDEVEKVNQMIAKAANISVVSVGQILETLKYAAPTMTQFGMSLEESLGWIATGAQSGLTGSMFGTNFSAMLTYLADAAGSFAKPKQQKVLAMMGLAPEDFVDAQGNLVDTLDMLRMIQDRMKNIGSADRAGIIKTLFSVRGGRAAVNLMRFLDPQNDPNKPYKTIASAVKEIGAAGANNEVERQKATLMESAKAQTILFNNSLFEFKSALVDVYNVAIVPIMRGLTFVIRGVTSFAKTGFGKVVLGLGMVGIAIATLGAGIALFLSTIALSRLSYVAFFGKGLGGVMKVFQMLFLNMTGVASFFVKNGVLWSGGKFIKGWGSGIAKITSMLGPWGKGIALVATALGIGSAIFPEVGNALSSVWRGTQAFFDYFGAGIEYIFNIARSALPGYSMDDAKAQFNNRLEERRLIREGVLAPVQADRQSAMPPDRTRDLIAKLEAMGKENNGTGDITINVMTPDGKILTTQKVNREQQRSLTQTLGVKLP